MTQTRLDITGDHCPMTFVKTKLQLEKLAPGEQLEVLLKGAEPLENVPRSATEAGYRVLSIEPADGGTHRIVIEKP
jgi:tRNA 2-thiouridine synthesizing protein A